MEPGKVLIFENFKYAWGRMVALMRSGTVLFCKGLLLRQSQTSEGQVEALLDTRSQTEDGRLPLYWALVDDEKSSGELYKWLGFSWDDRVAELLRTMRRIALVRQSSSSRLVQQFLDRYLISSLLVLLALALSLSLSLSHTHTHTHPGC